MAVTALRVLVRAYDLDLLRGTGVTIRALVHYLVASGDDVWATNTSVSLDEVRDWAPDIIIAQEWATGEASGWATQLGLPFVMLVHGPNEYETRLPQCDLVVFNTRIQQEAALPALGDSPSIVLHPPVFPSDYATEGRGEHLTLVAFDRGARKGWNIVRDLAHVLPQERFLLVANDTFPDLPANVEIQPIGPDMRPVYARTKLLLMPSEEETYGRVAVEAAMSGIPTVASDLPGIREATDGCALLVTAGDRWEDAVRRALRRLDDYRALARVLAQRREPSTELAAFRDELGKAAARGRRRPTLSLCMTVRNEGSTLARAIQSVASVVDEIIVGVDERSEDETLHIAQRMATRVFTFRESSPPDFARMRNRALERVRTDWAIMLDGHEWVEHPERIPQALETTAWSLETRILFEPDERRVPALSFFYPKIHRRGVRFVGPSIHEEVATPMEWRLSAPQIAVWHERVPGRALESRSQEKAGVELEILRSTWEEQGDRRALFYLANGLREAGRHDEAIGAYEEYLRAPCWKEEEWQARLSLARCHAARGDWQAAKTAYEQAIVQWPERAEAMVGMGDALLEMDDPGAAAAWFRVATTLKEPETARLFVEVPVYRWGAWHGLAMALWRLGDQAGAIRAARRAQRGGAGDLAQRNIDQWIGDGAERWGHLFDLGIRSYETGDLQAGNEACERLLSLGGVPKDVREQTRRNQVFYAPVLAELVASATMRELIPAVPAGWSRFNPTIAVDEEGYRVIVRSANYTLDGHRMHYTIHDDAGVIRTTNYLMELGTDLSVRRVQVIHDATDDETFPFPVVGFEDCRLFRHRERWWVTATVRDRNQAGVCQLALLELDGAHLRNLRLLSDAGTGRHEKNWMPVAGTDELSFIYCCNPTVVLRYDAVAEKVDEVVRRPGPARALSFRGGSQMVRVDAGWLCMIHESVEFEDGSRVMPHRFVLMSPDFTITHMSRQFFFLGRSVEFCAGLARRGETLVAAFGSRDREAYLAVMDLADALGTLAPVDG